MNRAGHWRVLLPDVFVVRVRGPANATEPVDNTKSVRDIQGDGEGDVAKRQRLRKSRRYVRWHRVCNRIREFEDISAEVVAECVLSPYVWNIVPSQKRYGKSGRGRIRSRRRPRSECGSSSSVRRRDRFRSVLCCNRSFLTKRNSRVRVISLPDPYILNCLLQ